MTRWLSRDQGLTVNGSRPFAGLRPIPSVHATDVDGVAYNGRRWVPDRHPSCRDCQTWGTTGMWENLASPHQAEHRRDERSGHCDEGFPSYFPAQKSQVDVSDAGGRGGEKLHARPDLL